MRFEDTSKDDSKNGERVGSIELDDTSEEGLKISKELGKDMLVTNALAAEEAEVPYDG